MEKAFLELIEAAKRCAVNDPLVRQQNIDFYRDELYSEADEISSAIDAKDYALLKEKLGDLLWDVLLVTLIAEREGHLKTNDMLLQAIEKIKKNKPYAFEGKDSSLEEASNSADDEPDDTA